MSQQIAVRLPDDTLAELDDAIASGRWESRAEAVREGIKLVLVREQEERIAAAYRLGYDEHPQEQWTGKTGAELAAEAVSAARPRRG